MRSGLKITEDTSQLPRLIADLTALKHGTVTVGWHAEGPKANRQEGGATNAEVAAVHEFGNDHVERRPSLGPAIDAHKDDLIDLQGQVLGKVIDGTMTAEQAMGVVGEAGVAFVKDRIVNSPHPPPLADATVAAKGSSKPLINTGQMLASVSYAVDLTGATDAG